MANEIAAASKPLGQKAIARFEGTFDQLRSAQVRMFQARQAIGLASADVEPPTAPSIASTSDGFLQQLEALAAAFEEMTKAINADIDAIGAAFK